MAMDESALPGNMTRMLRQYVDSLRAAGIEWIQAGAVATASDQAVGPPLAVVQPSADLFAPAAPTEPRLTLEQKKQALEVLAEEVVECARCPALVQSRTQTVFGVGNPDAELCFVGEAPGGEEDRQGVWRHAEDLRGCLRQEAEHLHLDHLFAGLEQGSARRPQAHRRWA